jgi:hypothetical protein
MISLRRRIIRGIVFFMMLFGISHAGVMPPPAQADETQSNATVLMPAFEGPQDLARNISATLSLQLEASIRSKTDITQDKESPIIWRDIGTKELSEDLVRKVAAELGSDLMLWGSIARYGSGFVVQPIISISNASESQGLGVWKIEDAGFDLELGLQSQGFLLPPILLQNDVVAQYSSSGALTLCKTQEEGCQGFNFEREKAQPRNFEGSWVYVVQKGDTEGVYQEGWLHTPALSDSSARVLEFSSGLFAYLRGSFGTADKSFMSVAETSQGLTSYDAYLLAGLARARNGKGYDGLEKALAMDPYSRFAAQALVMAYLSNAKNAAPEFRIKLADQANSILSKYSKLFERDDPWLENAQGLAKVYQSN